MLLALNPWGDIVEISAFSGSLYAACFLPTLVIGLFWKGGTAKGAVLSVAIGSATVVGWYCAKKAGLTNWHEVYVGLGVALVVYFVASLVSFGTGKKPIVTAGPNNTRSGSGESRRMMCARC